MGSKWVQVEWCGDAATTLAPALGSDTEEIKRQVENGDCVLWYVVEHGYMVTRLEVTESASELVLVSYSGKDTGPVLIHAQNICIAQGIQSIRFHTQHPEKLATRFVKKWGFERQETVYKWVSNGR